MVGIDQPIERRATPEDGALEAGIDGGEDPPERAVGHARQAASLDIGDEGLRDAGGDRDVDLAQVPPTAQDAKRSPDPVVIHVDIIRMPP
jgi:hypothetical protein